MNDRKPLSRPPPVSRASTLLMVVVCGAFLTLGALFFIWQRYQFIRLGFEVGELRQREAELRRAIEPLEVEAEYLARPERIEALARDRLGMRPPTPTQIIVLEPHDANPSEAQ